MACRLAATAVILRPVRRAISASGTFPTNSISHSCQKCEDRNIRVLVRRGAWPCLPDNRPISRFDFAARYSAALFANDWFDARATAGGYQRLAGTPAQESQRIPSSRIAWLLRRRDLLAWRNLSPRQL